MAENPLSVVLTYPLKTPLGEVKEISVRRPKVRDMKQAQSRFPDDAAGAELALISAITDQKLTPEDLEELDLADYGKVQAMFRTLLAGA